MIVPRQGLYAMLPLTDPDNQAFALVYELCHLLDYVTTCNFPALRHCHGQSICPWPGKFHCLSMLPCVVCKS